MAVDFGQVPAGVTLPIFFATYGKTNGESITMSGFAVTDIEVYKGTSMTQRASDNGYTLLDTDGTDIDSVTGLQGFSIDLSDNSDASFYAAGSFYNVVVSTVTVDSQTVTFIAATFRIVVAENTSGTPVIDVGRFKGTTVATPQASGNVPCDVQLWRASSVPTPNTAGRPLVDLVLISGAAVSTSTAQIGVNAVNIGGTAQTGRDIGASVLLSPGTGTGQVNLSSGKVPATIATGDIVDISAARAGYIDILNNGTYGNSALKALIDAISAIVASGTYGNSALKTLIDDVPTNAELATALGTADDAVLAAIAARPSAATIAAAVRDVNNTAPAANSLGEAVNNASGGGGGSGSGARTVTATVTDGSSDLENAKVRMTNGVESYMVETDVNGEAVFALDDATWTVAITKPGYQFAPTTLVVDGNETPAYAMTALNITPSEPDETTGYLTVRDSAGVVVSGATVQVQVLKLANGTTANAIDNPLASGTTGGDGLVEFPGLPRLATYQVRVGANGKWFKGVTLDADTTPLAGALGVAE